VVHAVKIDVLAMQNCLAKGQGLECKKNKTSWLQDRETTQNLGNYILTVKAEYLFIMSFYYSIMGNQMMIQTEFENFHRLFA
jgi:hypothetical protein